MKEFSYSYPQFFLGSIGHIYVYVLLCIYMCICVCYMFFFLWGGVGLGKSSWNDLKLCFTLFGPEILLWDASKYPFKWGSFGDVKGWVTRPDHCLTVDGRNPATPKMSETLQIMGYLPYQPVEDFSHQQYGNDLNLKPTITKKVVSQWDFLNWYGGRSFFHERQKKNS